MVVVATGHARHFAQRGLVQLQVHGHAFSRIGAAIGAAQPHHVDAHAAVGGQFGGLQGVDAGGASAVGQQDNGGRCMRAWRHRRDLFGCGLGSVVQAAPAWLSAKRHVSHVDAMVREQLCHAQGNGIADGRAPLHLEAVNRRHQRRTVQRGGLGHLAAARKGDQADFNVPGQVGQKQLGGHLRGGQTCRLDVADPHAQRHVHRQNDGGARPRQRHRCHRARSGQQQGRAGQQQQGWRHMAAPTAPRSRSAHHGQAAEPHRQPDTAAQQPHISRQQQGDGEHQPKVLGPLEKHGALSDL